MRRVKKTNALPPGTQNVSINMSMTLAVQLEELAKRSGMSRNKYCATVLQEAQEKGLIYTVEIKASYPDKPVSAIALNEKGKALTDRDKN